MKRRWRLCIGVALALAIASGIVLLQPAYWRAVGWLRGEAFYAGRPASYWASEFHRCGLDPLSDLEDFAVYDPPSIWQQLQHLGSVSSARPSIRRPPIFAGDSDAILVLLELLSHDEPLVRQMAAYGLGKISTPAAVAVPALEARLRDPDDQVQIAARFALWRIDPHRVRNWYPR